MKRIIQWFVPALLLVVLAWFTYDYLHGENDFHAKDIFSAIPNNSPFIVEAKDIVNFNKNIEENNRIHDLLMEIPAYSRLFLQMNFIDSIVNINSATASLINHQTILISPVITGKQKIEYLFVTGFKQKSTIKAVSKLIDNYFADIQTKENKSYEGTDIFSYPLDNNSRLYYASDNGLFVISKSIFAIESALKQVDADENLLDNDSFNRILQTAGKNSSVNLFLNHNYLPDFLSILLNKKNAKSVSNFKNYSDWTELDLTVNDSELYLNGFSFTLSDRKFLSIFDHQKAVSIGVESILPAGSSVISAFGLSDIDAFKEDFNAYRSSLGQFAKVDDKIKAINRKYKLDIEDSFYSLLDNEFSFVITSINNNNVYENAFAIFKTHSSSSTKETLLSIISAVAGKQNKSIDSYIHTYNIDEELSHVIYEMPIDNLNSLLFGNIFSNVDSKYFTLVDNYLVFANSIKSLKSFIKDNLLNKTLKNDTHYRDFSTQLAKKSNYYFYSSIALSPPWFSEFINKDVFGNIEDYLSFFHQFHALSFQFTANNKKGMVYNDIYLKYDPFYTDKPRTVWELSLDTTILFKPVLVKNHITGKKEIFVQDNKNKIYLINYAGRVLFEKILDEPILSKIYQIDYYNNSKLQFLFNTAHKLYLIDRKGNFVERFPVNLNSPATNGLALCDYDNNNDYRIFVACENRHVYLFSKEGNIIDGWKFRKSEHKVTHEVQHFRIADKDYIVFTDESKTYILNRKGKRRVKPDEKFNISVNGKYILNKKSDINDSYMAISDPEGKVYFVYFDGKVESIKFRNFTANHYFDYKDVNGDNIPDFIFTDENKLEVYERNKNKLIDYSFDNDISESAIYFKFPGNRKKLGIVTSGSSQIFLINSDGSLYDGFPLVGSSQFSIGSLKGNNKFNLFVGTKDNFLYNYEIK